MRGFFLIICLFISLGVVLAQQDLKLEVLEKPDDCQQTSKNGQELSMLYKGSLTNGKVFDSNSDRSDPFTFTLGAGKVIKGWDQGLLDMCVGEKRRLTVPPHLAYGERGISGVIPPRSTLIFEVELVSIE